jgi:DNA-binding LacI/PurR family transcriptional regulator
MFGIPMSELNFLFSNSDARPTFGVVTPFFWIGRYENLLLGIRDAAAKYRANLLYFQGYYCSKDYFCNNNTDCFEENGTIVYDLVKKGMLDGLIVNTGVLQIPDHQNKLIEYCKRYRPLPIVSVGSEVLDITNVLVNNASGIRSIMEHLINVHRISRIAYIRGPLDHIDSNQRFATYKKVLNEFNIPFCEDLVSEPGGWLNQRAGTAARKLLEKNPGSIEAFVCASDILARGVIDELRIMNIRVPGDIVVTGFDDDINAQACSPSITTVNQNLYGRGFNSVKLLIAYRNGVPLPENITVDTPVMIRQSCGCLPVGTQATEDLYLDSKSYVLKKGELLVRKIATVLKLPDSENALLYSKKCIKIFTEQIENNTENMILQKFMRLVDLYTKSGNDYRVWHEVINILECNPEYLSITDSNRRSMLINKARVLLSGRAEHERRIFLNKVKEQNAIINTLSYSFKYACTLDSLLFSLETDLPRMGIPVCYLCLFENPHMPLEYSRLVFVLNHTGRVPLPSGGILFPTQELIPENFISDNLTPLILEPLYYGTTHIGYTVFEFAAQEKSFYELFPAQLSAALWSAIVLKKYDETDTALKELSEQLQLAERMLIDRDAEYLRVSLQLNLAIEKSATLNRLASLGRVTADVADELENQLATIRAAVSAIADLLENTRKSSSTVPAMASEDHHRTIRSVHDALLLSKKTIVKAYEILNRIQQHG